MPKRDPERAGRRDRGGDGSRELVDLGSGAPDKARVRLDAMAEAGALRRYVPCDVSESMLRGAAEQLVKDDDGLGLHGVIGDFERHLRRVPERDGAPRLVALLGGTIASSPREPRRTLLRGIASLLEDGDTSRSKCGCRRGGRWR